VSIQEAPAVMWCEQCHYGSESCKMTFCPMCGSKHITQRSPFARSADIDPREKHARLPKKDPNEG
jgi:hypothetical protein